MSKLTIVEAVKRSGVSRTTFTNRYLKTGLVTTFDLDGKKYIKTAELTKAIATLKKKAPVKSTTARSKPISAKEKLTDVEMYKLKIKQLRAQLKTATSDNELLQKENESLGRKNVSLSRRLSTSPTKAKTTSKPKTKPPIITLSLPDVTPEKSIQEAKQKPRQRKEVSDNVHWVDKWWDGF